MSHCSVATSNLKVQEIVEAPWVQFSDRNIGNIDALGVLTETTSSNNPKIHGIVVVPKMHLGVVVPVVWQRQVSAPWTILLLVGQGLVRPLALPGREVSQ